MGDCKIKNHENITFYNDHWLQKANRMERFSDQTCLLLIRSLDISAESEEAHQQKRQNDQGQKENAEKTVKIEINKNSTNLQVYMGAVKCAQK